MDMHGVISALSPHSSPEKGGNYTSLGLLPMACKLSQAGRTVVLFDEIEKGRQAVDNMLLSFLQDGKIFVPHVGEFIAKTENLIFVATTNEQRMLSEPLYRRMRRHFLAFPDATELFGIVKAICHQEDFSTVGAGTVKFLINLALWYRGKDVVKKPTAPELAHLVADLAVLQGKGDKLQALLSWFSPHREDWKVLLTYNAGGAKYLQGML